ncbi:MAG: TIM44-like domain-containing protein [Oscillospiraceae bacterium]|jgi:hypothetical protein|nr:TIM44-like domain-containing protein [Oscillospiraceae bacterium]
MRKKGTFYIGAILVLLLACVLAVPAIADAGGFSGGSDYGGGSDYDYGGSGYDWGADDYGGTGFILFSGGLPGAGEGLVIVVLIAFIALRVMRRARTTPGKASAPGRTSAGSRAYTPLSPIDTLRAADPNFSETALKARISNLYVRMQDAWEDKKFELMRPYMTDALYNQFKLQLDELARSGCTNHVERIAVLGVDILGWRSDETNEAVTAELRTRVVDYISNDRTGKLVSGSRTAEKFMTYEWVLVRSKGMKTPEPAAAGDGAAAIRCPSCGAPLEINQSAKCPYCDSVINAADYAWVLSAVKGLSQRTGR